MSDAPEKKKRKGRRSHLVDFQKDAGGKYVYTGKTYRFIEGEKACGRYILLVAALTVFIAVCTVAAECLPPVKMTRGPFALLPWTLQLICAFTVVWATARLVFSWQPMREYVYGATVKKLPVRALLTAIISFLTVVSDVIFTIVLGMDRMFLTLLRPILSAFCGAASLILYFSTKQTRWTVVTPESGEVSAAPDDGDK